MAATSGKALASLTSVVTGAGAGIGRAVALRFAREGSRVVVADFNAEAGLETVRQVEAAGGRAFFQHCDVRSEPSVVECMAASAAEFGSIDVLVNNAASFVFGHLKGKGHGSGTGTDRAIDAEDWKRVWETNVMGYARTIEHALPYMRKNELTRAVYVWRGDSCCVH